MERPTQEVVDDFKKFYDATTFPEAQHAFFKVLEGLKIEPDIFPEFFPRLKRLLQPCLSYIYQSIWEVLENKSKLKVYGNCIASKHSVLVVGAGPCGLRTAIETQFLGAKTVIVEAREDFTRNNVLKLWKFLIEDLKSLGMKSFFPQFCNGDINHISIKKLQLVLAKICMIIGIKIISPVKFVDVISPTVSSKGWTATFSPDSKQLKEFRFDMLMVASGKNMPVQTFNRQSLGGKLAIAVTGNFKNHGTNKEQEVKEISGLSKQYNLDFFENIKKDKDVSLENIVYYKGDTHYFVMTATKESLLARGVLRSAAGGDRKSLFNQTNIDKKNLYKYVIEAAEYSTNYLSKKLSVSENDFAKDRSGNPDVAVFDFTNLYSAKNATHVQEENGCKLIMAAVGDSLIEPFWPEGTGCARGFLSALNAAWMLKRLAEEKNISDIVAERETLYKVLKQTSDEINGEILRDEHSSYTIDPKTRYKNPPRIFEQMQTKYTSRIIETDKNIEDIKDVQIRKHKKDEDHRSNIVSFSDRMSVFGEKGTRFKRPNVIKRQSENLIVNEKYDSPTPQKNKKLSAAPKTTPISQQRRPSPKSYRAPLPPSMVQNTKDTTSAVPVMTRNEKIENAGNDIRRKTSSRNDKNGEARISNDEYVNDLSEKEQQKITSGKKRFNFMKKLKRKKKVNDKDEIHYRKTKAISAPESSVDENHQMSVPTNTKNIGKSVVPLRKVKLINGVNQNSELSDTNSDRISVVAERIGLFHRLEEDAGNRKVTDEKGEDLLDGNHKIEERKPSKCVIL